MGGGNSCSFLGVKLHNMHCDAHFNQRPFGTLNDVGEAAVFFKQNDMNPHALWSLPDETTME